jgi:hypothetical protein
MAELRAPETRRRYALAGPTSSCSKPAGWPRRRLIIDFDQAAVTLSAWIDLVVRYTTVFVQWRTNRVKAVLRDVGSLGSLADRIGVAVPVDEIPVRTVDGIPVIIGSQLCVVEVNINTTSKADAKIATHPSLPLSDR